MSERACIVLAVALACGGDKSDRATVQLPPPPPSERINVPDLELSAALSGTPTFETVRDNVVRVATSACTVTLHVFASNTYAAKAPPAWDDDYARAKTAPDGTSYIKDERTSGGRTWTIEWGGVAGWGVRDRVALRDGRIVDCAGNCPTSSCAACVAHVCETIE